MNFVPDAATLLSYSVASIVLFITPGPDMSLFLARTLAGGRKAGFASLLGANLGCCVHTVAAALGLSALLAASPTAFTILKIVSAIYLLWLAYDSLRNGSSLDVRTEGVERTAFWPTLFVGVGVNLTNPKVLLFFISFLPLFVSATDPDAPAKMMFLGFYFIAINIPLSIALVLGADRLVGFLKSRPSVLKSIDWLFASVFGFFAVSILLTQGR